MWFLAVNSLWLNQPSSLLNSCTTYQKSTLNRTLYAVERCTVTLFRVLCLPMNALCRIAGIACAFTEMRADCLYLTGKGCISASACALSICLYIGMCQCLCFMHIYFCICAYVWISLRLNLSVPVYEPGWQLRSPRWFWLPDMVVSWIPQVGPPCGGSDLAVPQTTKTTSSSAAEGA